MIVVVSQAWSKDEQESADAYIAAASAFLDVHLAEPGFFGRRLIRGVEDRTHFTHLRFFDSIESYEQMTQRDGYMDGIGAMMPYLRPVDAYPREYMEVVLSDDAPGVEPPAPPAGDGDEAP
jgi:Antibiotic biosynthesis monooxygenase